MTTSFPVEKTVIVTGAVSQRGIGRAVAIRLAKAGWSIGIIDLDDASCRAFAAELTRDHGVAAAGIGIDVSDALAVRRGIDQLEAALPQLVGLVNVAGVSSPVPYLEVDDSEWRRVLDVNLDGVHYVSQRVAQSLVESKVGRIVSLSSVSAQRGGGTYSKTPYSVAKAAVIGLSRSLARELGPYGITVNAIAPGPIDTDIMGGTLSEERKRELAADGVLDRIGTVDDIAAAVEFLLSEESGFITGQTLNVDGGLYMH